MSIIEGRKAHEHAVCALSYLLNEPWSFEVLGVVRYELGQAYFILKKHLEKGNCSCGHDPDDIKLFKMLLIYVNAAITEATLTPIPIVVEELQSYLSCRKLSHGCITFALEEYSMTYDV